MAPPDVSIPLPSRSSRRTSNSTPNTTIQDTSPQRSRRTSAAMGPPPLPNHSTSSFPSSPRPPQATTVSPTMERQPSEQGPIRHPRPLTAAELHLELEKEQESIVNRLTRELSALRAQTASVASTASSTSDLFTTSSTQQPLPDPYSSSSYGGVSIIPTSARRHRSSSNLSARSSRSARDAIARESNNTTSVSGVAAPRDVDRDRSHGTSVSGRQSLDVNRDREGSARPEGSRQNSYSLSHTYSQGGSGSGSGGGMTMYRSPSQTLSSYSGGGGTGPGTAASPAQMHQTSSASHNHSRNHSTSLSLPGAQGQGYTTNTGTETSGRSPSTSFGSAHAAARYEEAAIQRSELDAVRRENEALRQRVRELERLVSAAGSVTGTSTVQMNGSGGRSEQTTVGT